MSTIPANDPNITTVTHSASGATVKIHALGATVLSFVDGVEKKERLFVSKLAKYDGSKAIRGGIPICFPIFGPPTQPKESTMPQHGFARLNQWNIVEGSQTDDAEYGATITYSLKFPDQVNKGCGENNAWNLQQAQQDGTACELRYEIKVLPHELVTTLLIHNIGTSPFSYQALLHTYLAMKAANGISIHGLGGYSVTDRANPKESGKVQSYDEPVQFQSNDASSAPEIDRNYIHPDDHPVLEHVTVNDEMGLEAAGQVEGDVKEDAVVLPVSCVVWNPGPNKAASMSDFDDTEYQQMVCVEPGLIGHQPLLEPQAQVRFSQTLRLLKK